jgi:hypothetical protein
MILAWAWTPALAAGGAILALGPVIIHLLNRRRFKILDWAAMRFLLESQRKNRRRLRIEELILLVIRVLVLLLAGFALANIRAGAVAMGPSAPVAHVFVLDDSLSMGQRVGADSIFQKATGHLAEFIRTLPGNDMVAILSASQPESTEPFGKLTFAHDLQTEAFSQRLRALKPTDLRAKFPESLSAAGRLLSTQPDRTRRLYLVSDFRRSELASRAGTEAIRNAFADLARHEVELTLLDYGLECKSNLVIEKVEMLDHVAVAGVKARFQAWVHNYGTEPADGANLTVQVGPVALPAVDLGAVGAGETVGKPFAYTFPEAGSAAIEVSVTPGVLPAGDRSALAVNVRDALRVLIVDGAPDAARPQAAASYCLARAIDPTGAGDFAQKAEVVSADGVGDVRFDDYDLAILANVGTFPSAVDDKGQVVYPHVAALEKYVRAGGGCAIFVGDKVNLGFYNGVLYEGGSGLSPFPLSAPTPATPDPEKFVRLRPDSIAAEPMLKIFTGRTEKFTRLVRFYVHMPAQEATAPALAEGAGPAQVLARFDDREGSPAISSRRLGAGSVIMFYSSADVKWTDWPKDLTFLPVVNDMVGSLARRESSAWTAPVGQKIRYVLPPALAEAPALSLRTPAYPEEDLLQLKPHLEGKSEVVEYASPRWAGVYTLQATLPDKTVRTMLFTLTIDPAEGDLAKADESEIGRAVGQPHTYRGRMAVGGSSLAREVSQTAYWGVLIATVLALLALEIFLAQRFGHYTARAAAK